MEADEHSLSQISRKCDAILTAIAILNQSINNLAAAIGADSSKMKELSDQLNAATAKE